MIGFVAAVMMSQTLGSTPDLYWDEAIAALSLTPAERVQRCEALSAAAQDAEPIRTDAHLRAGYCWVWAAPPIDGCKRALGTGLDAGRLHSDAIDRRARNAQALRHLSYGNGETQRRVVAILEARSKDLAVMCDRREPIRLKEK